MIQTIDGRTWQNPEVPGTLYLEGVGTGYCDEDEYTFVEPDGTQHDFSAMTVKEAMELARDIVCPDGDDRMEW